MANLTELLEDLEQLIRCESPSADRAAVARSAEAVARIGAKRMGQQPEVLELDGVSHLRWRFGEGPAKVLLLCHHDTVWPLGTLATHPYDVTDGVLRGPGCFDMKGGIVMAFHAVASLPDPSGVTVLVTGDEEVGSPSSRRLIESEAAGCAATLVLEAAADGGALKTGRKGVSIYTVEVLGRASHAGLEPERGVNATVEVAHQIQRVAALADLDVGTTVTPTVVTGGTTGNTVPARASFYVDVRVRSAVEQERVDDAMRALTPELPGAEVLVSGGPNRPPLEERMAGGLMARARRIADRLGVGPLAAASVGGASDGNFTAGIGVPTLDGLGPVGGGAHADHEHVLVEHLPVRTRLVAELVTELLEES